MSSKEEELSIFAELFTYESLVHAISGMTGGVSAITLFYPLNIIRTRLQVDPTLKASSPLVIAKKMMEESGFMALYQGWWSAVVSLGASNFVYFYVYNAFKALYQVKILKDRKAITSPVSSLALAAAAGVINVLVTTPLWVAGTRLTVQDKKTFNEDGPASTRPYTGVFDCLTRIIKDEGVESLWKGVGPSLMLVSNPSIQFVAYERLRIPMARIAEKRGTPITNLEFFVMGAIAKAMATVFTYPIQIAQSKLRADRGQAEEGKPRTYVSTVDCLKKILEQDGVKGWFKGMEAKLWQTVLTAAFQFLAYERVQGLVRGLLLPKKGN